MAERVQEAGVKPELEVFDTGDIQLANDFLKEGLIAPRALFQIVLGVKYGAVATPASMQYMRSMLPADAHLGGVRHRPRWAFPMVAQSWLLGGHCRVGLEDTLRLSKDRAGDEQCRAGRARRPHHQRTRRPRRQGRGSPRDARIEEAERRWAH